MKKYAQDHLGNIEELRVKPSSDSKVLILTMQSWQICDMCGATPFF